MSENSRAIVMTEVEAMGGAERSVLALSSWLLEQGLAHHFVMYEDRAGFAQRTQGNVVQLRPRMKAVAKIRALRRYFAERRHGPKPLVSGYQTAMHATLAGLRGFHCLMHDTPSLFDASASRARRFASDMITGYGLRSGGHTIVTSEYLQHESQRVFGVAADIARMGGLRDAVFRPRRVDGPVRLLSVSRVESNKRIDWLLRALATIDLPWRFDVVGQGEQLAAMRSLTDQLGLGERVVLHGFVSDENLQKLYGKANLFVMPAVQGYGIPAIEALQRGIPVLLHRDSGVSDILLDTPWATVVEGGEENLQPVLAQAMQAVMHGGMLEAALPAMPAEAQWAERVATLCGWV